MTLVDSLRNARDLFSIENYPGNLFEKIINQSSFKKNYEIFLFREDIGKLSGFIGYPDDKSVIICINYNRALGHQNFTLAHEIGHLIMHNGISISDTQSDFSDNFYLDSIEKEANAFAKELLYPMVLFESDYIELNFNQLIKTGDWKNVSDNINMLCNKYIVSYELVFRNILYKTYKTVISNNEMKRFKKDITKSIGGNFSTIYGNYLYKCDEQFEHYKRYNEPYKELVKITNELADNLEISKATANSLLRGYTEVE